MTRVTIRIYEVSRRRYIEKSGMKTDGPRYFYERPSFSLAFPPYEEFALSPFFSVKTIVRSGESETIVSPHARKLPAFI